MVAKAKAFLLAAGRRSRRPELRILGRRLLEVLDPEAADAEEARRLAARGGRRQGGGVVHDGR